MNISHVPELWRGLIFNENDLKMLVEKYTAAPSIYGEQREGIVIRITIPSHWKIFLNMYVNERDQIMCKQMNIGQEIGKKQN